MRFAKTFILGSMLMVPTMALGIAQEQDPATEPQQQLQQDQEWQQNQQDQQTQLQQDQQMAQGGEVTGTIVEVRDDRFSVRTEDQGVVWFMITPELEQSYSAELVTGNQVRVSATAGDSPDMQEATSVTRVDMAADTGLQQQQQPGETESDIDVDIREESATAQVETERESEFAQAESEFQDETAQFDTSQERDQLPRTASSLPLVGSLGLLAVLGAAAIAVARRL